MTQPPPPRRSVLYVPASNDKALAKATTLPCDAIVVDLEDAVAPGDKDRARAALAAFFAAGAGGRQRAIRINALSGEWGAQDLAAALAVSPDAILLPKVAGAADIAEAAHAIGPGSPIRLWAMVETAAAMLDLPQIAALARTGEARLDCLVAGTNDLAKETGVAATPDRRYFAPWLTQIVLAARAGAITPLDGVSNDFRDLGAFAAECAEAANLGFDGKTLIHPAQVAPANAAFTPSAEAVSEAIAIRDAFARPENRGRGVIALDGRMVERLHLEQAERLLARAGADRLASATPSGMGDAT